MPGVVSSSTEDIFESSLNLEGDHYQQGYEDGFKDGIEAGKAEGREVGLKCGFEVGEEMGYYMGCANMWKAAVESGHSGFSARAQRTIVQFEQQVQAYPLLHPEDERLEDMLEAIRVKFQSILSMLSIHLDYEGQPNSRSVVDSSF